MLELGISENVTSDIINIENDDATMPRDETMKLMLIDWPLANLIK